MKYLIFDLKVFILKIDVDLVRIKEIDTEDPINPGGLNEIIDQKMVYLDVGYIN